MIDDKTGPSLTESKSVEELLKSEVKSENGKGDVKIIDVKIEEKAKLNGSHNKTENNNTASARTHKTQKY